jgi:PAS domain S-box-containing protein
MNSTTTRIEYPIPEGEVLVSKTDLNGIITYCNNTFIEVSGYHREELIGSPHNLMRHPDMPQQAFTDLWKTIESNKPWRGLIKNLRKDGRYYWVESDITPLFENGQTIGYVAFRYKGTPEQIAQAEAAYQTINNGSSNLYIHEGKVVELQNRLMRWLNASSIKFRIIVFMSALFSTLLAIGVFNLHETSKTHRFTVDSLESTRMEFNALDMARMTELDFKTQLQTWKNILITGHNPDLFAQHLDKFDQQGAAVENRLNLLKALVLKIGMPGESVDDVLETHRQLTRQYHLALQSHDAHRPESVLTVSNLLGDTDQKVITRIEKIISTIQEIQKNNLRNLNYAQEKSYQSENRRAIVMLVVAALVGLFLSMRFVASLTQPIRRSSKSLKKVVKLQQHFLKIILNLEVYRDRIDQQQRIGNFIMSRMTDMSNPLNSSIKRYTKPAEHLSGDILIASITPGNAIHILLADAVGHGLTAAINVLPLCQIFYDLTQRGFQIDRIAVVLNEMIHHFMPVDRFVSATLISIDRHTQVVKVWNGGIPPIGLFNLDGRLLKSWDSQHLPLGILSEDKFSAETESFRYQENGQLCLFSDGFIEARSAQGQPFGMERIIELFGQTSADVRFDTLVGSLNRHLRGRAAHDDISLAIVDIATEFDQNLQSGPSAARLGVVVNNDDWRIALSLGANELKYLDIVPLLTRITKRIHLTRKHNSALFQILSELFNNALDQGILQLGLHHELNSGDYEKYLELRNERLQILKTGKIELETEHVLIDDQQAIKIRVAYRGGEFNDAAATGACSPDSNEINLTRSLAYKLECTSNEITAYYLCN